MVNETATIPVRIELAVKKEVKKILEAIGPSTSEAVNFFFQTGSDCQNNTKTTLNAVSRRTAFCTFE
jgi:hypothetical protein